MNEIAISVQQVGKRYRRAGVDRPSTLKEALLSGRIYVRQEFFWGLRGVTFDIARGRAVGLVGRNGAGKSSLLRLIGGVGKPNEGQVRTKGRIGALLDLGAGMDPDLTGRENVAVAGVIAGLTAAEVRSQFASIVEFAEIADFINNPVRTYSTGMRMRLAFAVAVHIDPDILLIDEVLAVGDAPFQRKCMDRIKLFKKAGCTIVVVSHDPQQLRELCDDVVLLRQGMVIGIGSTEQMLSTYEATAAVASPASPAGSGSIRLPNGILLTPGVNRFGTQAARIVDVRILSQAGAQVGSVAAGEAVTIEIAFAADAEVRSLQVNASLCAADGTLVFETRTHVSEPALPQESRSGRVRIAIPRLDLVEGDYSFSLGLYEQDWHYAYDLHNAAYPLTITVGHHGASTGKGLLNPPVQWSMPTDT